MAPFHISSERGTRRYVRPRPWLGLAVVLVTAAFQPGSTPSRSGAPQLCLDEGPAHLDRLYAGWTELLRASGDLPAPELRTRADSLVVGAFHLDAMAEAILEDRWGSLHPVDKGRFRAALVRAIRGRILPALGSFDDVPRLRRADETWSNDGDLVQARYWLVGPERRDWFALHLATDGSGVCRVLDIRRGDRSLVDELNRQVEKDLGDYAFPYMVARLGDYDEVVLEDFEDHTVGELPRGWTWRSGDADKNKPYRVRSENGNRYLEATDEGESVILGREEPWNIEEYPYISFRVRVKRVPPGGNERDDDRVDSAAGLYFTLNKKLLGTIPESVKYVWSTTLPVGTAVRRDGIGRPWQVVFDSGPDAPGEWRTYVFDLRQAYRDTFGGDPPKKTVGIGVLSDANSMGTQAYADYDDIRALRTAPPGVTSGVLEIVPPLN